MTVLSRFTIRGQPVGDAQHDSQDLSPAARRVLRELRRLVLTQQVTAGARLPSVRVLAARTGLSPFPVQQALKHIEAAGWARREHGKGSLQIVPTAIERARRELEHEPPLVLSFVSVLHQTLSYEHQAAGLARRMSGLMGHCSTRHLHVQCGDGGTDLAEMLAQGTKLPNEVAYVLFSVPRTCQALFSSTDVPCVVNGYSDPGLNLPTVYEDMNLVGYRAGEFLCPGGRVVALHFGELVGAEVNIIDGMRRAAREAGVPESGWEEFYIGLPEDLAACESAIGSLLASVRRPAGILALRPEIAMLAVRAAFRQGIRVPDELQIIGYGSPNVIMYDLACPAITSVGPKSEDEIARRCSDLLARSLGQRPRIAPREMLESAVVERQTTRRR
jgi:DNA-binding LacI/PurR family transcriptional regulator/DNA-binding transcriptional regulator YhcF (GntR family)